MDQGFLRSDSTERGRLGALWGAPRPGGLRLHNASIDHKRLASLVRVMHRSSRSGWTALFVMLGGLVTKPNRVNIWSCVCEAKQAGKTHTTIQKNKKPRFLCSALTDWTSPNIQTLIFDLLSTSTAPRRSITLPTTVPSFNQAQRSDPRAPDHSSLLLPTTSKTSWIRLALRPLPAKELASFRSA